MSLRNIFHSRLIQLDVQLKCVQFILNRVQLYIYILIVMRASVPQIETKKYCYARNLRRCIDIHNKSFEAAFRVLLGILVDYKETLDPQTLNFIFTLGIES